MTLLEYKKMRNLRIGLNKNLSSWRITRQAFHISQSLKMHNSSPLANRRNFDAEKIEMKSAIRTRESVFSIEKVVELLKQEAVLDLCVIKVPPERIYVEYFVICSPRNDSQLVSVPAALSLMYKEVFGERKYVEGLGDGTKPPEWTVIDLGTFYRQSLSRESAIQFALVANRTQIQSCLPSQSKNWSFDQFNSY